MSAAGLAPRAAYALLRASGVAWLRRRLGSGGVILCFHNVVPDALGGAVGDRGLHMAVSRFAAAITWLRRAYSVVPLGELLQRLQAGRPTRGLAAVTFDDAYAGMVRHAVPVMRRLGVPFAVFPVVRNSDAETGFWWDELGERGSLTNAERERCLAELRGDGSLIGAGRTARGAGPAELRAASWDALRSVLGSDCTIGSHTVTHRNLAVLTTEEVTSELAESRQRLGAELGVAPDIVAYPYGLSSAAVGDSARRAGYRAGLTLRFGLAGSGHDPFALPRVNIPSGLSVSTFACWSAAIRLRTVT